MNQAIGAANLRDALRAWWAPRLERIADWVAETETNRRAARAPEVIVAERKGAVEFVRPGGAFRLTGQADRIERYTDGALAILDYKTGTPPTKKAVADGLAPQLPLEAAMAAMGGFGADLTGATDALVYWHLSGGGDPGKVTALYDKAPAEMAAAIDSARDRLCDLIDTFDDLDKAYLSRPYPDKALRFPDYEQLARVAEWSSSGDEDE
jgi:ATP-dependent helicase/nuclease subunit B